MAAQSGQLGDVEIEFRAQFVDCFWIKIQFFFSVESPAYSYWMIENLLKRPGIKHAKNYKQQNCY